MTISESKYFIVSPQTAAQISVAQNTAHTEKTTTQAAAATKHKVSDADMIHSLTRLRQLLSVLRDTI